MENADRSEVTLPQSSSSSPLLDTESCERQQEQQNKPKKGQKCTFVEAEVQVAYCL